MPKISDPTKLPTETIVAQALALKAQIAEREAELKSLTAAIIARGPGKHSDADGNAITVVEASDPGTKLLHLDEETAAKAREICGVNFKDLYKKEVSYIPQTGFLDRAEVLLGRKGKAALEAIATEATKGKAAYVLFPKK